MPTPIHLSLWINLVVEAIVHDLNENTAKVSPSVWDGLGKATRQARSFGSLEGYGSQVDGKCRQSVK